MSIQLDRRLARRDADGHLFTAALRSVWVLQTNGSLSRTINRLNVTATETLAQGYSNEALTVPIAQPFVSNADGEFANVWFAYGVYDFYVPDDASNPIRRWQVAAGVNSAELVALDLRTDALESSVTIIKEAPLNPRWPEFGALFDSLTDDTAAIQACLNAAKNGPVRGRGQMHLPPGSAKVTALTLDYTTPGSLVDIVGSGKRTTELVKIAGTTTPVLSINGASTVELYNRLDDFSIRGNAKGGHGLRITDCARFELHSLDIRNCDRGIDNVGSLVFTGHELTLQANNDGMYNASSAAHPPNLIKITDSQVVLNTNIGVRQVTGLGLILDNVDFENNGTAGNVNTGAVFLDPTVDDLIGVSWTVIRACWFENNLGRSLQAFAGDLTISDGTIFLTNESGRDVYVDGCRQFVMENSMAPTGAGGIVNIASSAVIGAVNNCFINTFTNNSPNVVRSNAIDRTGDHTVTGSVRARSAGSAFPQLHMAPASSRVELGSGGAAADAFVTRRGAGIVGVTKLAVDNSAAATVPGACVKKIEVFDAAGASLGFIPVYSAIT